VVIDEFSEQPGRKDLIRARIVWSGIHKKHHHPAKNGQSLRKIGRAAAKEIEAFSQRPVFLELWGGSAGKVRKRDSLLAGRWGISRGEDVD
jgi:GTPase Era involved in 16S rRNA processing